MLVPALFELHDNVPLVGMPVALSEGEGFVGATRVLWVLKFHVGLVEEFVPSEATIYQ